MTTRTVGTAKQTACGAEGPPSRATTTLTFGFGAGTFVVALCKTCSFQMQGDLYKWVRAGDRISEAGQRRRLGDCGACFVKTKATTWQTFDFERSTYAVPLCDRCADKMHDDLIKWSRTGTLVDEHDNATLKPVRSPDKQQGRRRGDVVARVAPDLVVPILRVVREEEPEAAPRIVQPRYDSSRPWNADQWVFTAHALQRMAERNVSEVEALWCAANPDTTLPPNNDHPDCRVHRQGRVQVVVNPDTHEILTVIDRSSSELELLTELELLDAS